MELESSGCLFGENKQKCFWWETKGSTLKLLLFIVRRIKNQIPSSKLMSIVHSLWMSKLHYGLQLCTKVRLAEIDPTPASYKALQLTQNRMLMVINNCRISDKINNKTILKKFDFLSISWHCSAKIYLCNFLVPFVIVSYH